MKHMHSGLTSLMSSLPLLQEPLKDSDRGGLKIWEENIELKSNFNEEKVSNISDAVKLADPEGFLVITVIISHSK